MVLQLIVAATLLLPGAVLAKIEITPQVLGSYLTSQGNECQTTEVFKHGEITLKGKVGQGWSVKCSNGKSYAVAVEDDAKQTAWWATCDALKRYSRYQCFVK